jgi:hypothetical protein
MSIRRIATVALSVTALGIVAGALVGALGGIVVGLVFGQWPEVAEIASAGGLLGGAFGLLLGPLAGFGVLRDVPLWRAIVGTGCGALIGILGGAALGANFIITSLAGFALGAAYTRIRYSSRRRPMLPENHSTFLEAGR